MAHVNPLTGSCSCGRNRFTVQIPPDSRDVARLFFNNSSSHRRAVSHPLPSYLHIPLSWYSSTTHSYFPDELAHTIRRVYTSPDDPSSQRYFCGFCGTPLSYWCESPPEESDYISLTLGTLHEDDLRGLEELGIIPEGAGGESETENVEQTTERDLGQGVPWFESMVSGSRLGNIQRSSGTRRGGNWSVEWEIVESTGEETPRISAMERNSDNTDVSSGKRKLDDTTEPGTVKKG